MIGLRLALGFGLNYEKMSKFRFCCYWERFYGIVMQEIDEIGIFSVEISVGPPSKNLNLNKFPLCASFCRNFLMKRNRYLQNLANFP